MSLYDIDEVVTCLQNGGCAIVPTDTVYGLAVMPGNKTAMENLYKLKGRPKTMNLPIMVAHKENVEELGVEINDTAQSLLSSPFMPGALTLILGLDDHNKPQWLSERSEIALRIPDDEHLQQVLEKTGPLFVTSANRHGAGNPETLEEIKDQLDGTPDMIIDGGRLKTVASTIVNCNQPAPEILRAGLIAKGDLAPFMRCENE